MSFNYKDYVNDKKCLTEYESYQDRYTNSIRESDKKIIEKTGDWLQGKSKDVRVLDVGCSTGNLLYHLNIRYPDLELVGCDFAESSINKCKNNPKLKNIQFHISDVTKPIELGRFDIIIVNAVFFMMSDDDFAKGLLNLNKILKEDGLLVIFDFAHDFNQELKISEISKSKPLGLDINFRSKKKINLLLSNAGFSNLEFINFKLPIDLPLDKKNNQNQLNSHTIKSEDGERLIFRGILYQPWCHIYGRS